MEKEEQKQDRRNLLMILVSNRKVTFVTKN